MIKRPTLISSFAALILILLAITAIADSPINSPNTLHFDPPLPNDPRFQAVGAHAERGTAQAFQAFLPAVAGSQDEIIGKVADPNISGALPIYVATVGAHGARTYYRTTADANGMVHFRLPPDVQSVVLFEHFNHRGQIDVGSECAVTDEPIRLAGTQSILRPPTNGPALLEANSVYERGGRGQSIMRLQTRGVDPLSATINIDGQNSAADIYAASSRNVVARIHDDQPLGRHSLYLLTNGVATNSFLFDLISIAFDPLRPTHPGAVQDVTLHITGLPAGEKATVLYTVTGSATLAAGGSAITLPVQGNMSTIRIRSTRPGRLQVTADLTAQLGSFFDVLAEQQPPQTQPAQSYKPQSFPTTGYREASPQAQASPGVQASPLATSSSGSPTESRPVNVTPSPLTPTEYVSAPPRPSATPSEPPTPRPCDYKVTDGWFEPSQAVWQDDPKFLDLKNRQLVRLHDMDPVPHYDAELPMVLKRDSVLVGVHHYYDKRKTLVKVLSRPTIVIRGITNCQKNVGVHMSFYFDAGGSEDKTIYESEHLTDLPLDPPRKDTYTPMQVSLPAPLGIPPKKTFTFTIAGGYVMRAEVMRDDGTPTGLKVIVSGDAHATKGKKVRFVPVYLRNSTIGGVGVATVLKKRADQLREQVETYGPDYYPLAPGDLPTESIDAQDFSALTKGDQTKEAVTQALLKRLEGAEIRGGADRVVAIISDTDYGLLNFKEDSAATAFESNVIVLRDPKGAPDAMLRVIHELVHTLPQATWSSEGMLKECAEDYHNKESGWANGIRLVKAGRAVTRTVYEGAWPVMGSVHDTKWITQCTYYHLFKAFRL